MKVKTQFDNLIEQEIVRSEKEYKKSLAKKAVKKTISKKEKIKSILMGAVNKMSDNSLENLYAALIVGGPMIVLKMGADEISSGMFTMDTDVKIKERKKWDKAIEKVKSMK